jgi:uncharacterized protein HemX
MYLSECIYQKNNGYRRKASYHHQEESTDNRKNPSNQNQTPKAKATHNSKLKKAKRKKEKDTRQYNIVMTKVRTMKRHTRTMAYAS